MSQRLKEDEFWIPPKMRCVADLISSLVGYHTVESSSTECFPFLETSAPSNSCDDLRMGVVECGELSFSGLRGVGSVKNPVKSSVNALGVFISWAESSKSW